MQSVGAVFIQIASPVCPAGVSTQASGSLVSLPLYGLDRGRKQPF